MKKNQEKEPLLSKSNSDTTPVQKKFSLLPPLVVLVLGFSFGVIGTSYYRGTIQLHQALWLLLAPLAQSLWAAWLMRVGGGGSSSTRFFECDWFLRSAPILWLPFIVVIPHTVMLGLGEDIVVAMVRALPLQVFVALQAVRVLAVGSLIKWYYGIFPPAFAWGTAFPDMLFGLSAVWLLVTQSSSSSSPIADNDDAFLVRWCVLGIVIILPVGVTILQLGMAPTQLYQSIRAPNRLVFCYPMILAPAVVVPALLCWNATVALALVKTTVKSSGIDGLVVAVCRPGNVDSSWRALFFFTTLEIPDKNVQGDVHRLLWRRFQATKYCFSGFHVNTT